ncbi:MAG TPA: ABC transporter substrate-binding protein [Stellaceae bacterium]|nr:ABC transporter substrate-binding protein [Stellaceae bacterium]
MVTRMIVQRALAAIFLIVALPAAAPAKDDTVSVGLVISLAQAPYYIAEAKGYFAAEHIAIDSGNFSGAQDAISALATGRLDVSLGAISAGFFNAQARGLDLRAVAALGIQPSPVIATPPVVRKDLWDSGAIKSGADFKGRKIAVNVPGSIPEYLLTLILAKYHMTLKDVDETTLGFPQQVIAFKNKGIDVGFLPEPFAAVALKQGSVAIIKPEAAVGTGDLTTMVFFSGHFMRDRPDVAERFLRAVLRGARDAQGAYLQNPQIDAMLAKETGLKADAIAASIAFDFDPNLDIAKFADSLRRQEHVHMMNGRLNYKTPLPMDRLIDASLVHKAAASLK